MRELTQQVCRYSERLCLRSASDVNAEHNVDVNNQLIIDECRRDHEAI